MKNVEEFKKKLKDPNFFKNFSNVRSTEDVVKIASDYGYDITVNDIENYALSDDLLDSVAGGKDDTNIYVNVLNQKDNDIDISIKKQ